jgi:purine nucleosidase/pyrimidine-specific ribonucleoside hydrolase
LGPKPVILDVDPGHDDAVAVMMACGSPGLDLLAVTTVAGNATLPKTTRNALRVLSLIGRADVPVAAGASGPLVRELRTARTSTARAGWTGRRSPRPPSSRTNGAPWSSSPTPSGNLPSPLP